MSLRRMFFVASGICLVACGLVLAVLWPRTADVGALTVGFVWGAGVMLASLVLLLRTWGAAGAKPKRDRVPLLYGARVVLIFGSVVAAMFLPGVNALGVVVPQLLPGPVLALLLALDKG